MTKHVQADPRTIDPSSCLVDSCWVLGCWLLGSAASHRCRIVTHGRNEPIIHCELNQTEDGILEVLPCLVSLHRTHRGSTLREATEIGMDSGSLSRWERGQKNRPKHMRKSYADL